MINYVYQLVRPQVFSIKYQNICPDDGVLVRPRYMSICHADQRYYLGQREQKILDKKLPMALIHECCGEVICDKSGTFSSGQNVVLIPNVPGAAVTGIFENYLKGSGFLSSGRDGFMRETVCMPAERLVAFDDIPLHIASITEFVSVGVHACTRFSLAAHEHRGTIGIWGDGSLSYVLCCVLKSQFPDSKIVVVGKNPNKLSLFSFADKTYLVGNLPGDFAVDHAFECAGGEGSYYAIDDIIRYINPQGTAMLLGVSENKVAINTRDILEKGLTLLGSSRSGRADFEQAVSLLRDKTFQRRLQVIIYEDAPVRNVKDIHRAFATDLGTPFKTAFEWNI